MGELAGQGGASAALSGAAVLRAIVGGARAWSSGSELAHALAATVESVLACLCDLAESGEVEGWDRDGAGSVVWTLTPLSAARLRVDLAETGLSGRLAWVDRDRARRVRRGPAHPQPPSIEAEAVEWRPGPYDLAERSDEIARYLRSVKTLPEIDRLPRPTVILTGSQTTWTELRPPPRKSTTRSKARAKAPPVKCSACRDAPGPGGWCDRCGAGVCPCCRSARLKPTEYCLRCSRWGFDGLARSLRRARRIAAEAEDLAKGRERR